MIVTQLRINAVINHSFEFKILRILFKKLV